MITGPIFWLKCGAILAVFAVLSFAAYKVHSWRQDALQLGAVRQEMVELKAAQAASHKASEQYQNELETIRKRRPASGPVRLCIKPDVSAPASGSGSGSAAPRMVPGGDGENHQEGPDIAADLAELARRADEVNAQARAIQGLHR
jgi:hypothetical protein